MPAAVIDFLVKQGLPGVVILGLAIAYYRKDQALTKALEARLEDAKEVTQTVVDLHEKSRTSYAAIKDAIEEQTPALDRIEAAIQRRRQ